MIDGKYSYARILIFEWFKEIGNLARNYYERLGHFAQGFIPALIVMEIFIRYKVIKVKNGCLA